MGDKIETYVFVFGFIFMVFASLGWVLELLFRRFVSAKKWVNPGFLKGPCLPIYGIGVLTLSIYILALLPVEKYFPNKILFDIVVIGGIGVLMTLIELIGGLIFIKKMNIRLWDYSNQWGNYKGVICPLFSLIWMAAGAIFYYFLFDNIVLLVTDFVRLDWFVLAIFLMGIYYGIFAVDFASSLQLGNKLKKAAKENKIIIKWENFKEAIQTDLKESHIKASFISPFKSPKSLYEHLVNFIKRDKETEASNKEVATKEEIDNSKEE